MLPLCALAVIACAQAGGGGGGARSDDAAARDTLRGIVEVVGPEPATSIALRAVGGDHAVTLEGERGILEQMQGLEVAVWGRPARPGVFRVERAAVRASNGVPTVDGVLARAGDGYVVVTMDGDRVPVSRLPEALRGRLGSRVWLAGPPHRDVDSYGVIDARP